MRLLVDTNVVLDVLLAREPFAADSARVLAAVEEGRIQGYLCATTVTTLYYLTAKHLGQGSAREKVGDLLKLFTVAPVTGAVLAQALLKPGKDYEDAVLVESARLVGAQGIVTRNPGDFQKCKLPVYLPGDVISVMEKEG